VGTQASTVAVGALGDVPPGVCVDNVSASDVLLRSFSVSFDLSSLREHGISLEKQPLSKPQGPPVAKPRNLEGTLQNVTIAIGGNLSSMTT
jgi:hypothetical protein